MMVAGLLPHGPEAVLLERVMAKEDDAVTVSVAIRPESPFCLPGRGVPAHVGLEYMAQACGAFAGLEAQARGEPVRLGFLLGTRRYHAVRPWFAPGEDLAVTARLVLREGGMAVFDCCITLADTEAARAQLTVFQPGDGAP